MVPDTVSSSKFSSLFRSSMVFLGGCFGLTALLVLSSAKAFAQAPSEFAQNAAQMLAAGPSPAKSIDIDPTGLERFFAQNDWYIPSKDLFFQIYRHRSGQLVMRTCPTYGVSTNSKGERIVQCSAGKGYTQKVLLAELKYSEAQRAFVGVFAYSYWFDYPVRLGINSQSRRPEVWIGNESFLTVSATGVVSYP